MALFRLRTAIRDRNGAVVRPLVDERMIQADSVAEAVRLATEYQIAITHVPADLAWMTDHAARVVWVLTREELLLTPIRKSEKRRTYSATSAKKAATAKSEA